MVQFNNYLDAFIAGLNFEMFTESGNEACRKAVARVFKKIYGTKRVTAEEIEALSKKVFLSVAKKHGEVRDTEPRGYFRELINNALKDVGYSFELEYGFEY